jgi:glucose/arabinose dehydrogenase
MVGPRRGIRKMSIYAGISAYSDLAVIGFEKPADFSGSCEAGPGLRRGVMPAVRLGSRVHNCVVAAAGLAVLLCLDVPASSQQPVAPPRGSPLNGRPGTEGAMKLAPVAAPAQPTALDRLPVNRLKLPPRFKIEVYASGVPDARSLRVGDRGTVFAGTSLLDKVYAVASRNGRAEVKVVASGLYRPNGLAFKDGTLYIAELSQISKIERVEDNLDDPAPPIVIYDDLPKDEANGRRFVGIGPDNRLYVTIGLPCNNCIAPDAYGQIRRINLDGSGAEVLAHGLRNSLGFDWHPVTRDLYFSDNGRDWFSEELPHDELNRVTRLGQHFGAPYCYGGDVPDQEFGWGRSCSEFVPPVAKMGPHAAVLGMRFYTGNMFPPDYKDAIFVARHGSWNKTVKTGGDVVAVKLNKDGSVRSIEPFLGGFISDNNYLGRPVDVAMMKDGSLLVSDDWNGAIYRVTYGNAKPAHAR